MSVLYHKELSNLGQTVFFFKMSKLIPLKIQHLRNIYRFAITYLDQVYYYSNIKTFSTYSTHKIVTIKPTFEEVKTNITVRSV